MPTTPTLSNWIALITLGLIWGASFLGVALALEGYTPLQVAAGRIAIGAITLTLIALAMRVPLAPLMRPEARGVWVFLAGMGIFSNVAPFFALSWSQQHVTSGFAGITMASIPLFVLGLAHFLVVGEALTRAKATGFVMGLIGVGVLMGPGVFASTGSDLEVWARLGCLAAALSYAVGAILTRRCPPVHPVAFGVFALWIATVLIVPIALVADGLPVWPDQARAGLALVYLGLGPTGFATLLLVQVIRSAGPSFLSQVNYHVPVWSVLLGVVVLAEPLPGRFILALGIIIAGLMLSRRRSAPA